MRFSDIQIVKRDGKQEAFSIEKIKNAITRAFRASNMPDSEREIYDIAFAVAGVINTNPVTVEEIQDLVEKELMAKNPTVAKKYIIYRDWRNTERHKKTDMKTIMDGIVAIEKNDVNLSNANMSAHTPAGQMMTFAAEVSKDYSEKYLLNPEFALAHRNGDIHIHDLDYYPTKTTTCIQYDLEELFEKGFRTKNGSIRTPQSIQSYATLATIVFQTNQNEQHGGQSIPAFDFFMAPGILKSFQKNLALSICLIRQFQGNTDEQKIDEKEIRELVKSSVKSIAPSLSDKEALLKSLNTVSVSFDIKILDTLIAISAENTRKDTHQAMEGLIH
ncbi:MAG: anaerobic ribonucleoside triphosphate reductase, partial [Treponema sp.]|nr:anaerobic ribonucleoside triphosphate reductase [Treponema sp.]